MRSAGVFFGSAASRSRKVPKATQVAALGVRGGPSLATVGCVPGGGGKGGACGPVPTHPSPPPSRLIANTRALRQSIVFPRLPLAAWRSPAPSRKRRNGLTEFGNEALGRFDHEFAIQLDRLSTESANRLHNLQQIAAVAGARRTAVLVVALVQVVDGLRARRHAQALDHGVEDALVDLARRRQDLH